MTARTGGGTPPESRDILRLGRQLHQLSTAICR